jgi:hypothetical protein
MKKQLFTLITLAFASLSNAQIQQNDTTICLGDSLLLNVAPTAVFQSCTGQSPVNYSTWTAIAPSDYYVGLNKLNGTYYARASNDVYKSQNLLGPWVSMNFNSQFAYTCASELLGVDQLGRLHISSCHNGIYYFDGSSWVNNGFAGIGCAASYFNLLNNGRIVMAKGGGQRSIYYSDNNGSTWTNATNVDVDYVHITVADNGDLFACSAVGGTGTKGVIKSTDNGSSWVSINSVLGITTSSAIYKDCQNNLWIMGDNKIFKSEDDGLTWTQVCSIPNYFTAFPQYGHFLAASNGTLYCYGWVSSTEFGLFSSVDQGNSWILESNTMLITRIREYDGNVVAATTTGILAKTLTSNYSYLWSTGETTQSITVSPTISTTYTLQTTINGSVNNDSVAVTINPPTSSTQTQTALDSYTWPVNGQTYTQSGTYTDTLVNAAGCDSIVTLNLTMSFTSIEDMHLNTTKKLLKITDLNGRVTPFRKNTVLLFIYEDGTVERVFEAE